MIKDKRAFAPFGVAMSPLLPTSKRSYLCTRSADVIYRPQDMCGQELGAYADPSGDRDLAIEALSAGREWRGCGTGYEISAHGVAGYV